MVPFATGLGAGVRAEEKGVEVARTADKAADAAKTSANVAESAPAPGRTDFIVDSSGQAFPVPKGATGPTPVISPAGKQTGVAYTGGKGGANGQVDTLRNMDSTPPRGVALVF